MRKIIEDDFVKNIDEKEIKFPKGVKTEIKNDR